MLYWVFFSEAREIPHTPPLWVLRMGTGSIPCDGFTTLSHYYVCLLQLLNMVLIYADHSDQASEPVALTPTEHRRQKYVRM